MSILGKTKGEFKFIIEDDSIITYVDWLDIPEDFEFKQIIKFQPDYPKPPHTAQDHAEMAEWHGRLTKLMEMERKNARRN